jgi:uncharacterized protein involved in outer membrane biogenesis
MKIKKSIRRIAWGVFIGMAALATLSVITTFDSFKPRVEALASEALGMPTHIKGHIKLGFLGWRPAAVFYDVALEPDVTAKAVTLTLPKWQVPPDDLFVKAEGLTYQDHVIGDYYIPVHILKNGFDIARLEGGFDGADIDGNVKYIGDDFHMGLTVKGLPLHYLLEEAEGKVDGQMQMTGKGTVMDRVVSTLNGRFLLTSGGGKITSKSLNFWSRGLMQILLPMQKTETNLNCAVVDFDVKDGLARSRTLIVDTSEISIFGNGNINLPKKYVDILLTPKPKGKIIKGPLSPIGLVSFATPVRLRGPIDNIVPVPQVEGMAKKVGGLLLGVVNPALIVLPLLEDKMHKDYNGACVKVLEEQAKPI